MAGQGKAREWSCPRKRGSSWDGSPRQGPRLLTENSRDIYSKVKATLFREIHILYVEFSPSWKTNQPWGVGWLVFMTWIISYVNKWEKYSIWEKE